MLVDKIDFLAKETLKAVKEGYDKNLIPHVYLELLNKSTIGGNIFMCRIIQANKEQNLTTK